MESSSDDIILPEAGVEVHVEPPASKSNKKNIILAVLAAVVFLALVGALIYVIANNSSTPDPDAADLPRSDAFRYDEEFFNNAIDEAEECITKGDYITARELLAQYNLPERMTAAQRYRFYSALTSLYSESALNDAELRARYEALASQSLKEIRKGE